MRSSILVPAIFGAMLISCAVTTVRGQVSVEEAEKRLKAKMATKPSTTKPAAEIDRLREENLRLRERVMSLELEVTTLKESLARASKIQPGPATQPTPEPAHETVQKSLAGRWRGGDITAGAGYILQFDADGTYKQLFIAGNAKDTGEYRFLEDGTMEMWGSKWPEGKKHNQYRVDITPVQLTLTPLVQDGVDVKLPRAVILRRAE